MVIIRLREENMRYDAQFWIFLAAFLGMPIALGLLIGVNL